MLGIERLFNDEQKEKAELPIEVTELGIERLFNEEQKEKAE